MRRRRNRTRPEQTVLGPLIAVTAKLALALLLALAAAEGGSALALRLMGPEAEMRPPLPSPEDVARLYDTTDYHLYQEALAETRAAAATVYAPFAERRTAPFTGRRATVSPEGVRGDGAPQDLRAESAKVFVFGGSTVFGIGVPDAETLPAQLETALKEAGKEVQVFNFGTDGHHSTAARITLEQLLVAGHRPDVAVFVEGLEDFVHCAAVDAGPSSARLAEALRGAQPLTVAGAVAELSRTARLMRHLAGKAAERRAAEAGGCSGGDAIERAALRLDANRRLLSAIAERMGFAVVFVQQPVPFFHYDQSRRPQAARTEPTGRYQGVAAGYARLAEMRAAGEAWEPQLLWLAELEPAEGNAYIDAVHYSPRFARTIADAVAGHILASGRLP
ncbi:SGNH/GDSL hydrolase family protein [Magnetospirillum sp. UT-4]|uniref:SGNH/GDSL hydrolase family protein n=1 Tax=Magnetospirillum sp. UT-4 TaxID=2681467 RepID=UPI0013816679|nr:SGNH/GDSL hydrolase family protein [Magnetospirillum sp. UT-4]CAA7619783.1 conserved exported hypothetical protein [Magnetospirillum sp. UT-4]